MVRAMNVPGKPPPSPADVRRGILWMLLTMLSFTAMDTIAKHLTADFPVPQVVWARYFFTALLVVAILRRRTVHAFGTRRLGLQIVRALLSVVTATVFFVALSYIPLADATSLVVTAPIIVAALSAPLLGERVGARQWVGVGAGFAGALIIIRPGIGVFQWAALLPMMAAFGFALHQMTARILSRTDSAATTLTYTVAIGLALASMAAPFFWVMPGPVAWLLMAVVGLLGGVGQFALIKAFEAAPAATVAPFAYTSLVWAAVLGFAVFDDLPDMWTVIGAAVVVASGLYLQRSRRAVRQAAEP